MGAVEDEVGAVEAEGGAVQDEVGAVEAERAQWRPRGARGVRLRTRWARMLKINTNSSRN